MKESKQIKDLEIEELRNGIYIPSVDACWLYKSKIERINGTYKFDNDFKNKILTGKLDFSFELLENKYLRDNIEVIGWVRNDETFYYTLDIVNVKFDKTYNCKYGYIEKDKVDNGVIVEDTFVKYNAEDESQLIKTWYMENKEEKEKMIELKKDDKVEIKDFANDKYLKVVVKVRERSSKQLRKDLYKNGFKFNDVEFSNWKRSGGKARVGNNIFIKDSIKKDVLKWARMGLDFEGEQDIASIRAYESLPLSSIIGTINIDPNKILVVNDFESKLKTKMSKTYLKDGKCITKDGEVMESNSIWDGEGLLNKRIFDENEIIEDKGFALLRNRFMKCAGFSCKIQKWYKDNFKGDIVKDMYGNEINIEDIDLITTPSSIKLIKYNDEVLKLDKYKHLGEGAWLQYWKDNCGDKFGVCKTEKPSHFDKGKKNRLSYQMINSMPLSRKDINELLTDERSHITKLKSDLDYYLKATKLSLEFKEDLSFDNEDKELEVGEAIDVQMAFNKLVCKNREFANTKVFKDNRRNYIAAYIRELRKGKIKIEGDYCTACGNPIELLYSTIGQFDGSAMALEEWEICSSRFKDNEKVVGFRNPHISISNIGQHTNKSISDFKEYFNCTPNIVFFNAIGVPILSMYNGEDYDSDSNLLTNNKIIVEACEKIDTNKYRIPKNDIVAIKVKREFNEDNMAEVDHFIATNYIGQVVNTSQEINSLLNNMINGGNDKLNFKHTEDSEKCKHSIGDLYNRASKLSSISNCEIDKAKKNFEDLKVCGELEDIKDDLVRIKDLFSDLNEDKRRVKPLFFKVIGDSKALKQRRITDKKELNLRKTLAINKYVKDKNLNVEDVVNKKGDVKKEYKELQSILKNVTKEWEIWRDKIYVEYDTPMDYLQVELDSISDSPRSANIYLRDFLKEVKHKADSDEIKSLALKIEELDKKIKGINLNENMTSLDKYINKEDLKNKCAKELRELKLTKAKIYHLLKRCFRIKKLTKKEKEDIKNELRVVEESKVIKGIENITIEVMFRAYGEKFIDMFKSSQKENEGGTKVKNSPKASDTNGLKLSA
ncbi:MAG: hypothetical protein ACRDCB_12750 [Clostridium sp.]|uniref:hypothetical protein n=1 Tax=Clostridium sp. TaxID=1506 RepID=UPI003EE71CF6